MLPKTGKLLGLDYGTQNIGVAITDPERVLVFPRMTLKNTDGLLTELAKLVEVEAAVGVVVGLPYYTDHTEAGFAIPVRRFVDQLNEVLSVPVFLQDEKLTTFDAEQQIAQAPKKLISADKDQLAAKIILEEFLRNN